MTKQTERLAIEQATVKYLASGKTITQCKRGQRGLKPSLEETNTIHTMPTPTTEHHV